MENGWCSTSQGLNRLQEAVRKEAFVVGVADPTGLLPEGEIMVPGIPEGELLGSAKGYLTHIFEAVDRL